MYTSHTGLKCLFAYDDDIHHVPSHCERIGTTQLTFTDGSSTIIITVCRLMCMCIKGTDLHIYSVSVATIDTREEVVNYHYIHTAFSLYTNRLHVYPCIQWEIPWCLLITPSGSAFMCYWQPPNVHSWYTLTTHAIHTHLLLPILLGSGCIRGKLFKSSSHIIQHTEIHFSMTSKIG